MNVPGGVTTTLLWMNSHEDKKRKLDTMLQAEAHRSKFKTKKISMKTLKSSTRLLQRYVWLLHQRARWSYKREYVSKERNFHSKQIMHCQIQSNWLIVGVLTFHIIWLKKKFQLCMYALRNLLENNNSFKSFYQVKCYFLKSSLKITRKYPHCGYILGVITHTNAWDRH